jgi:glutaredoxin 3
VAHARCAEMVRITSTLDCPYCEKAEALLSYLGVRYSKTVLNTTAKKDAFKASGFTTVPQIWFGDRHIGGYTELKTFLKEEIEGVAHAARS